jgi:hypothetical protein
MEIKMPSIKVSQYAVAALAVTCLAIAFLVHRENRRLRRMLDEMRYDGLEVVEIVKPKPCKCHDKESDEPESEVEDGSIANAAGSPAPYLD